MKPGRAAVRVGVVRYGETGRDEREDRVAAEEPMEIRIAAGVGPVRSVAVTMRTPGDDEELAVGFLFSEGFVGQRSSVAQVVHCPGPAEQRFNVVEVRLAAGAGFDSALLDRNFLVSSSCGVCGKASLDTLAARGIAALPADDFRIAARTIHALPAKLRAAQGVFERTGGLHAAGLFDAEGERLCVREDVGRHNAVDKVIGWSLLDGRIPLERRVMVVSGRASFEILQKVAAARVPVLVAVGAPSSLAVQLARRFGVTLIGFAKGGEFNVYAGAERLA